MERKCYLASRGKFDCLTYYFRLSNLIIYNIELHSFIYIINFVKLL